MAQELSGLKAFVTGSGRGLGRTMAERLAELGADVAIHDLDWTSPAKYGEAADIGEVAKQMERFGGRTAAVVGNIGDQAAVRRMAAEIDEKLGPLDVLVNCAGGDIGAQGGKPNPNNRSESGMKATAGIGRSASMVGPTIFSVVVDNPRMVPVTTPTTTASSRPKSAASKVCHVASRIEPSIRAPYPARNMSEGRER